MAAQGNVPPEPFVDQHRAAEFLSLRPRRVLELARARKIPSHPIGDGARKVWRFRLSELDNFLTASRSNVFTSSAAQGIRKAAVFRGTAKSGDRR